MSIKGLGGENLANAIMKAETKAKRRVTLSVAGLGWLDETEVSSVPDARPVNVDPETGEVQDAPTLRQRLGAPDKASRVNWRAFWVEAKRLGFDQRSVHALAGAQSIADLDREAVEELLERMRERAEEVSAARPPEDE